MDTEKMFELADRLRALRDEKAEAEQHLKEIKAEMDEVDAQMSTWKPDSALMQLNRAPLDEWFAIPAPLAEVLRLASAAGVPVHVDATQAVSWREFMPNGMAPPMANTSFLPKK